MADLAAVFHWTPPIMDNMYLNELMNWHNEARLRSEYDATED